MEELRFTSKHYNLLLDYCKAMKIDPRMSYAQFHKKYSYYDRRQSTIDLINKAYRKKVVIGPDLYANVGIEIEFFEDLNDPLAFLDKCEKDNETTLAFALHGDWSFIRFKYGASMLEFTDSILPYSYSENNFFIENISFDEKGKLPRDPYPHRWSDDHWEIYRLMRKPREVKIKNVLKYVEISWETVVKYFYEVCEQCKVISCFFPLGRKGYSLQLVTFKTDYEIGLINALKRLNRTTFVYKANGTIILCLNLIPRPFDFNISTKKFFDLEEKGYIRDLHVCTPIDWHQDF